MLRKGRQQRDSSAPSYAQLGIEYYPKEKRPPYLASSKSISCCLSRIGERGHRDSQERNKNADNALEDGLQDGFVSENVTGSENGVGGDTHISE